MELTPKFAPGFGRRAAAKYGDSIGRLHAQGYSLNEISAMLATEGVAVGRSTIHREVARFRARQVEVAKPEVRSSDPTYPTRGESPGGVVGAA